MTKIIDIYNYLCELAPLETQMDFDNSGFQLGHLNKAVNKVLLSLDITNEVIDEAIKHNAELIITHHPLMFKSLKTISDSDPEQAYILKLIEHKIAVMSMHTNLDIANGGVNDCLLKCLGAKKSNFLGGDLCGLVGEFSVSMHIDEFLKICKAKLNSNGLRYYSCGKEVKRLAVVGGSGGDYLDDAFAQGCDTLVTADIKYHQFLRAAAIGINLIDADHFCTENPVMYSLQAKLSDKFSEISFMLSEKHVQLINFA